MSRSYVPKFIIEEGNRSLRMTMVCILQFADGVLRLMRDITCPLDMVVGENKSHACGALILGCIIYVFAQYFNFILQQSCWFWGRGGCSIAS